MRSILLAGAVSFAAVVLSFASSDTLVPARPRSGPVEILRSSEIKPGMRGVAWTVFTGSEPEPVPVEIIGLWKNAWGPKQDVILGKLGGKAKSTNVAAGMSGSPVYIGGKLAGAIALRLSMFSPDAICGITPIELMLEINDFDATRPAGARTPDKLPDRAGLRVPAELLAQTVSAGAQSAPPLDTTMVPIETPLLFAGFHEDVLREFGPLFQQLGLKAVQGGASGALASAGPAPGWRNSLAPGDVVAGVLVSGDMSVTGLGTVTYNDGKRVLAFGHPFFNLGPLNLPMSKGEVLMVLSSAYAPTKIANATEIVGALRQDRHSGIMGVLGRTAPTIPVSVLVRSFDDDNSIRKEKTLHFRVAVEQKWTPTLMMFTLYNSISGLNDFAEEVTYRLSGKVEMDGMPSISLNTMQAQSEMPIPAPLLLAGWWGDKFGRLFSNAVKMPTLKAVNATIDLLPRRRIASVERAWIARNEVTPGEEIPVKVFLRPYRGERVEKNFTLRVPVTLPKGEHRILLSDADTLNRMSLAAGTMNRYLELPQTVALINQERANNKLYAAFVQARPAVYSDDKALPSLPASVLNVMQNGRSSNRHLLTSAESAVEQAAIPFDFIVSGSYTLRITVN
jgi:hypothetical protein